MAEEIVELNDGTDDLIVVGIQRRGVQLADRIVRTIFEREKVKVPARRPRHHALSRRSANSRPAARGGPNRPPLESRRQARRDRRRRALHRTHGARGARRARGLRAPVARVARGARRSRRARAADPRRHRREEALDRSAAIASTCSSRSSTDAMPWSSCARSASDERTRQGPPRPRIAHARPDPPRPRHRRSVQGDQRARNQEGAGAARADDRQSVLRSVHAHAHLVRVRGEAPVRGHGERRVVGLERAARARRSSTPRAISRRCGSTWS